MKKMLFAVLTLAGLAAAQAQGFVQFVAHLSGTNEVPPNSSSREAAGSFTLNSTTLTYEIGISGAGGPISTNVTINGPANAGVNAPVIFDLGAPVFRFPNPPIGAEYGVGGEIHNLTSPQINDLISGLWYVNTYSPTFPDGEVRGQITLVPEPSAIGLLLIGSFIVALWKNNRFLKQNLE
jgi:hypothetical protein